MSYICSNCRTVDLEADWGVIPGGLADITANIAAAQTWGRLNGCNEYRLPQGRVYIDNDLIWLNGEHVIGRGENVSLIGRRALSGWCMTFGDWGNYASGFYGGGFEGFTIFRDYGDGGLFPNPVPSDSRLMSTGGGLIRMWLPSGITHAEAWLIGGQTQMLIYGGVSSRFRIQCTAMWDPAHTRLQDTIASVAIDGDVNALPTTHTIFDSNLGGTVASRTVSLPNGQTRTGNTNLGAKFALDLRRFEGLSVIGGYIGQAAQDGIHIMPQSGGICSGLSLDGTFLDSCARSAVSFDNSNGVASELIRLNPVECNGQFNGLYGITDQDSNVANWSVIGLEAGASWGTFVHSCFDLKRSARTRLFCDAENWNSLGLYTTSHGAVAGAAAGLRLGSLTAGTRIDGLWGGGSTSTISGNDTVAVRNQGGPLDTTRLSLGNGTVASGSY